MDFSLKKKLIFFTFGGKIVVVTIYENVAFFFLIQRRWMVLRYSAKKSMKNGFETTDTISRSRGKFYRDVAFLWPILYIGPLYK
jgi:hypothetical protein